MNRFLVAVAVLGLVGCSNSSGTISLTARPSSGTQALLSATDTGAGATLSRVRLLINEAELRGGGRRGCRGGMRGGPPAGAPADGVSFCMHRGRHVEQGPFIVAVDAAAIADGSASEPVLLADVPAGTYQGAELELAPLGSADASAGRHGMGAAAPATTPLAELGAEFDDFKTSGATLLLEGTWNGQAFTYQAAFQAEQETPGPLTVDADASVSLGLVIDASGWFLDGAGAALDPTVAANHDAIAANITRSLTIEDERPRH